MEIILINNLKKYGLDGLPGPQGATGPDGSNGATGPQGPTGPDGSNGATGTQGYQGPSLQPQGPQGVAGTEDSWDYIWYKNTDTVLTGGSELAHITPTFTAGTYLMWLGGQYSSSIRTVEGKISLVDPTTEADIPATVYGQNHYIAQTGYKYNFYGFDLVDWTSPFMSWNSSGSSGGEIPCLCVINMSVDFKVKWNIKHNVGDVGSVTWYKHSFIKIKEVV